MMKKSRETSLFVFGNGFDLAHGYKTRYSDFKKWLAATPDGNQLVKEIEGVLERLRGELPDYTSYSSNADDYNDPDNWLWSDLENALRLLPDSYENLIDEASASFKEREQEFSESDPAMAGNVENDPGEQDSVYSAFDFDGLDDIIDNLYAKLSEWIGSVDSQIYASPSTRRKWSRPFKCGDTALTFNYTHTLEKLYKIPRSEILHIHGETDDDTNPIILGHDVDLSSGVFEDLSKDVASEIVDKILGYSTKKTAKPTELIIERKERWFDSLKRVDNVLVYGHSLSEVDLPYFWRLMEATPSTSWCIYTHNSAKVPSYLLQKAKDEKIQLDEKDDKEFWNRS